MNQKPVKKGSIIVAKLSDFEKLPKNVKDHKREAVVVLKDKEENLGTVDIHGKNSVDGKSRKKKEESGLWKEIEKNGQEVYVDINIRIMDAEGNPIRQGKKFKNTGILLDPNQLEKVEEHLFKSKKRNHSIRAIVAKNKSLRDKKKTK